MSAYEYVFTFSVEDIPLSEKVLLPFGNFLASMKAALMLHVVDNEIPTEEGPFSSRNQSTNRCFMKPMTQPALSKPILL